MHAQQQSIMFEVMQAMMINMQRMQNGQTIDVQGMMSVVQKMVALQSPAEQRQSKQRAAPRRRNWNKESGSEWSEAEDEGWESDWSSGHDKPIKAPWRKQHEEAPWRQPQGEKRAAQPPETTRTVKWGRSSMRQ